jgi:hypothetical protein
LRNAFRQDAFKKRVMGNLENIAESRYKRSTTIIEEKDLTIDDDDESFLDEIEENVSDI